MREKWAFIFLLRDLTKFALYNLSAILGVALTEFMFVFILFKDKLATLFHKKHGHSKVKVILSELNELIFT